MAKLKMKCFKSTSFLTVDFLYLVLILTASFQIFGNRMPEQRGPTRQNTEALNTPDHSRHSSYREMLLEHLFYWGGHAACLGFWRQASRNS